MSTPPSINPASASLTGLLAIPVPEIRTSSKSTTTVASIKRLHHLGGIRDASEES